MLAAFPLADLIESKKEREERLQEPGGLAFAFERVQTSFATLEAVSPENDFAYDAAHRRANEALEKWAHERYPSLRPGRTPRFSTRPTRQCDVCRRIMPISAFGKCSRCYARTRRAQGKA